MRLGVAAAVVGDTLVEGDVDVDEGRIEAVGLPGSRGGSTAVPGFMDIHTHGFGGVDFSSATESEIEAASVALASTGVTRFQPTLPTMSMEEMQRGLQVHASAQYPGAKFCGTHLEGPFLSPLYPGAHPPEMLLPPDLAIARDLVESGNVAQMTVAPELAGALELIDFLVSAGVAVSIGHSDADATIARAALARGANGVTHVFNASRPLRHRDPGIIGVSLTDPGIFVTAVFDGIHLSREVAIVVVRSAGSRLVAITDAMAAAGLGEGEFTLGRRTVNVVGSQATTSDGTIASSVVTMDTVFRNLLDLGLSVVEAAAATSTTPAKMAGLESGSLATGSVADLVVLDEDFAVSATYIEGTRVYSI